MYLYLNLSFSSFNKHFINWTEFRRVYNTCVMFCSRCAFRHSMVQKRLLKYSKGVLPAMSAPHRKHPAVTVPAWFRIRRSAASARFSRSLNCKKRSFSWRFCCFILFSFCFSFSFSLFTLRCAFFFSAISSGDNVVVGMCACKINYLKIPPKTGRYLLLVDGATSDKIKKNYWIYTLL